MTELWTDKYRPESAADILGQPKAVSQVLEWLGSWKPGKAMFLHGPPGTGKSALVEALAQERGLFLLRMNASDERNSEQLETIISDSSRTHSLFHRGKLILLDEVDGISGRVDRGAINAIIRIIKESMFPVFLVANEPYLPRLRPLRAYSAMVRFSRIRAETIGKRLEDIARAEGIGIEQGLARGLARWSQGDMRSAITDLQTVSAGRQAVGQQDLDVLGYRERASSIFEILPAVFRSGNISSGRKAIRESDMDPDDIFLWVESNLASEFALEKLPEAYELLAKADLFRARVIRQQNWRFKAFMSDLLAGISVVKGESGSPPGFRPYQAPDRIIQLARTRAKREAMNGVCRKIGELTHTSAKAARREYIPYLKILARKSPKDGISGLEPEDLETIAG
jgi:replication factor C large subunit